MNLDAHALVWPLRVASWAGVVVGVIGVGVLLGSAFGAPVLCSLVPGWPRMAVTAATAFVMAGVGLWCAARVNAGRGGMALGRVVAGCALVMLVVGGVGLLFARLGGKPVSGVGSDPWRMSPATAVGLLLLGGALLGSVSARGVAWFQALVLGGALIGWLGFSHYLYGGEPLYYFGTMSFPTSLALLLLSLGLICVRGDGGLTRVLVSPDAGGVLARRLMPFVVLAPICLGWIRLQGQNAGWYGLEFGLALFALSNIVVFGAVVWVTAARINRADHERRLAEDVRLRLGEVVAGSDDAIMSKSLDGIITSWNQGAEKLFGYSALEAIGRPMVMLFPPELAPDEAAILARIRRGENIRHFDTVRVARDGRRIDVSVTISPIRDRAGRVIGASKIARDIGERVKAERTLRQQARLLAKSQKVAHLGCIEVDHSAEPWQRVWSDETFRLLGLDPATTVTGPAAMLGVIHPDDHHVLHAAQAAMQSGRQPADADVRVGVGAGSRILHMTSEIAFDPATGKARWSFTTLQDVTDERRSEERFRLAIEAAPAGMLMIDHTGSIVLVNAQVEKIFGHARAELIGQSIELLMPERFRSGHSDLRATFFLQPLFHQQARPVGGGRELFGLRKDGSEFPVEIGLTPLKTAYGDFVLSSIADISERVRVAAELRRRAEQLAKSQQVAHLGSMEVEFPTQAGATPRRSWSDETYRLLGLVPGAVPASREAFLAAAHPDDLHLLEAAYVVLAGGKAPDPFQFRVPLPGGQERILLGSTVIEVDPASGRPLGAFCSLQDVTVRVRAERAIRHQTDLLERTQRVARLGCIESLYNPDGTVSRVWSDESCRLFGLPPGREPTNAEIISAVLPADRARIEATFGEVIAGHAPAPTEFTIVAPSGGERILYAISEMNRDAVSGRNLSVITTIQDITATRQAAARIHAQLGRLEHLRQITHAIGQRHDLPSIFQVVVANLEDNLPLDLAACCRFDSVADCLIVTNIGARSRTAAQALGLDVDDAIPIDANGLAQCVAGNLVYQPDVAAVPFPFPQRLAKAGLRSLVAVPLAVGGAVLAVIMVAERQTEAFSSPDCEFLRQLGDLVALAVAQAQLHGDLKTAYDELRQSQQAMMQQERLRALGQMAGGIAHDINNAIAPAMIYTEWLLEQEAGISAPGNRQLATVKRAIEDVAHTVARLREFYRRDEAQAPPGPVDLNELVAQVIDLTRARWHDMPRQRGKVVHLISDLPSDLPRVLAIAPEVREALINLVFNAVDAMPEGGTLTLATSSADGHVRVAVSDTGIGMSEDTRRRCLEPFFTTKGERGTGIGLAMVYGIVQRHGAAIDIKSEIGKGTTMRLDFPLPQSPPTPATETELLAPARRLRLLVIDDDPRLLQSLVEFLETDGHEVIPASDGRDGVTAFLAAHAESRAPELVITDLGMPNLDGRGVAQAIKAVAPGTPVILLTGWGQRLIGPDVPPEVDLVLDKPPSLAALRQALSRLAPRVARSPQE